MTDRIFNQIAEMKKQTIGVEVEMNNIRRDKAAKLAAEYFGTGRCADTHSRNGYSTWSAWDAQGREWKFQRDVSITGIDSEKCEMVTPILKYDDMELYRNLSEGFAERGQRAMRAEAAEFTFTSEQRDIHRRHSEILQTLWQATRTF